MRLEVGGMTCAHCERNVCSAISAVPGVRNVTASARAGEAIVSGEGLDPGALAAAVEAAGYNARVANGPVPVEEEKCSCGCGKKGN